MTDPSDSTIEIWDVAKEKRIKKLDAKIKESAAVRGMAYSPDGKYLATISLGGILILWDAKDYSELARVEAHSLPSTCLVFYPDSKHFATAGAADGLIKIWSIETKDK